MDESCAKIEKGVLIKYTDKSGPFPIGSDIVSYGVTKFDDYAFSNCQEIQELYIPWYVEEIPETNFVNEKGKIQSPDFTIYGEKETEAERVAKKVGINFIETNIWTSKNKMYAYFGRSEKFVMPEGIVSTWGSIFECAPHIAEVKLPSTLCFICGKTFLNCKNIKEIVIPKSVNGTGSEVFKGCKNLQSVTFENGETNLGDKCFTSCPKTLVIKAPAGGKIEEYAKKYKLTFEAI